MQGRSQKKMGVFVFGVFIDLWRPFVHFGLL